MTIFNSRFSTTKNSCLGLEQGRKSLTGQQSFKFWLDGDFLELKPEVKALSFKSFTIIYNSTSHTKTKPFLQTEIWKHIELKLKRCSEFWAYFHSYTYSNLLIILLNQVIQKFQWSHSSSCRNEWIILLLVIKIESITWSCVFIIKDIMCNGNCWCIWSS